MMQRQQLEQYLNEFLQISQFSDYGPNGLQVEGRESVSRIVTGTTASLALIEAAIEREADAILVHHGYFWKGEDQRVVGMKKQRLSCLLKHDMNLFGYHLPLDAHPELGNNAELARLLGMTVEGVMDRQGVGNVGSLSEPVPLEQFAAKVAKVLKREPMVIRAGDHPVRRIGWCTGGAQKYLLQAAGLGVDTYLSGEISESTVHEARETGVHYIAAGHHATERYGVQALGRHLAEKFSLEHHYVELENPA